VNEYEKVIPIVTLKCGGEVFHVGKSILPPFPAHIKDEIRANLNNPLVRTLQLFPMKTDTNVSEKTESSTKAFKKIRK